jgi:hypothetical protein
MRFLIPELHACDCDDEGRKFLRVGTLQAGLNHFVHLRVIEVVGIPSPDSCPLLSFSIRMCVVLKAPLRSGAF